MRIIIGCEESGTVREAMRKKGQDAWSCDLKPSRIPGNHIQDDLLNHLDEGWDMGIFHPDCTYLTSSAEWAYKDPDYKRYPGVGYHQKVKPGTLTGAARRAARTLALSFVMTIRDSGIPFFAIENPVGFLSSAWRKPDQIIQPYQFGDDASKATCLWLEGLPKLQSTKHIKPRIVNGKPRWGNQTDGGQNRLSPSETRAEDRSKTYQGIADAMAAQWGTL